ncbi:hypothetical protein SAMN04488100_10545 [Alkalibacterium putridalgicola]|uniref:Uncharacterized protein n=1 Tax=Alkalibacterium putridalgicola TaxID=426703 RepID=A0A1H7RMG7_9LACT|nr:hypothetical protein [Alkalibacterium putridalgicola]GEK88904.1 hypothetical protein APU01nite_09430 [Alkalibacterium putridalgicola]SEL61362.1 hypothetical protein SAMN04488100_10545 [Alkalibacterium putridalgicola]
MKNITVTLYTTEGDVSLLLTPEQVIDLSMMLQEERRPIPLVTSPGENESKRHDVVGMLIQGRTFTDYPRVIAVAGKEDRE